MWSLVGGWSALGWAMAWNRWADLHCDPSRFDQGEAIKLLIFFSMLGVLSWPKLFLADEDLLLVCLVFGVMLVTVPSHSFGNGGYRIQKVGVLADYGITSGTKDTVHLKKYKLHLAPAIATYGKYVLIVTGWSISYLLSCEFEVRNADLQVYVPMRLCSKQAIKMQ